MKDDLAMSILKDVMSNWDINKLNNEITNIQIISDLKYDDYQQYTHGMRYVESLALWLRQFDNTQREQAYQFIKNNLVFLSREEMYQLVECSFDLIVKPYIIQRCRDIKKEFGLSRQEMMSLNQLCTRRSLFLGLSDGAHIDVFRRHNTFLSNEQVFIHYDFSNEKALDMKEKLSKDIHNINLRDDLKQSDFKDFFLIDDFSASGKSFIRKENTCWHGKIKRFYDRLREAKYNLNDCCIHLILYAATKYSLNYIESSAKEFFDDDIFFTVDALQIIEPLKCDDSTMDMLRKNYEQMIEKYGNNKSFEDTHFRKGNGKKPYLGFGDCSLPLVIYHNTPNNSFPIIWHKWDEDMNALFQRVTRHRE